MNKILQNFAPSWPSVVMGTGIVPVALLFSEQVFEGSRYLGIVFFLLSVLLFIVIFGMSLARLITAPEHFARDMRHPVLGSFVSTLLIAAMVLAIDFMQVGPRLIDPSLAHHVALVLFFAGTLGIYALGLASTAIMFDSAEVKMGHTTFGWFIPPVSQLIVPVAGLDLAVHYAGSSLSATLFIVSIMSLGIGFLLFLFVAPNVYHRYLYHELPASKMAPTVMIGLAPTAILVIILVKLAAISALPASPWSNPAFPATARLLVPAAWGFSAWWFVLASVLLARHFKAATSNFALSWWALSFPVGALAVATGALNKLYRLPVFTWITIALTLLLLAIWVFVALGTIRIIADGSAFEKHE